MKDTKGFIKEIIPQMDSPEKVYELFHGLGYKTLDPSFDRISVECLNLVHQGSVIPLGFGDSLRKYPIKLHQICLLTGWVGFGNLRKTKSMIG